MFHSFLISENHREKHQEGRISEGASGKGTLNMEREDWIKTGLVAGGAVLGLLGERVAKSKMVKKALVKTTAAALRVQKCAAESSASLQAQADDIVAAAKEENQKLEDAEAAEKAKAEAAAPVVEDEAK